MQGKIQISSCRRQRKESEKVLEGRDVSNIDTVACKLISTSTKKPSHKD